MDRTTIGDDIETQEVTVFSRPSVERNSPRLQKKPPLPKSRTASQLAAHSSNGSSRNPSRISAPPTSTSVTPELEKVRKSSIRNVVRRIFGRRSREREHDGQTIDQEVQQRGPRHVYHASEPPNLSSTAEEFEPYHKNNDEAAKPSSPEHNRAVSEPPHVLPPIDINRARSPHAIEFPRSARLKPLDLGNPFMVPNNQLRRRKTLPTVLVADSGSEGLAEEDVPRVPTDSFDTQRTDPSEIGVAISNVKSSRRRSRSVSGLGREFQFQSPPRNRKDEIRYWRESYQGNGQQFNILKPDRGRGEEDFEDIHEPLNVEDPVLRQDDDKTPTPMVGQADPFDVDALDVDNLLRNTPPYHYPGRITDNGAASPLRASTFYSESSKDLEDRVAKLEAGLRSFQRSLQKLTADRNRRTIVLSGDPIPKKRSWDRTRTPSMLADTLVPSTTSGMDYRGAGPSETDVARPATSPAPAPDTPMQGSPAASRLALERQLAEPFRTPSSQPQTPARQQRQQQPQPQPQPQPQQPQEYTFRSLYQMLADERSARRKLETQLRSMRSEISNLQYQFSAGNSARNSSRYSGVPFTAQGGAADYASVVGPGPRGSQRLHDLLREQESEPNLRSSSHSMLSPLNPRIMSRFSDTQPSEAGAAFAALDEPETEVERDPDERSESEAQTPYEAYQTPAEEYAEAFPMPERPPWMTQRLTATAAAGGGGNGSATAGQPGSRREMVGEMF